MKKVVKMLCLFLIFFVSTVNVQAKGVVSFGDEVIQKGEFDSTRFVAGNEVISKAVIDGLSFVAGNDVVLEGTSTYGFYAGNDITVREHVLKDMFAAGNHITIDNDAIIERDVYVAGNKIDIKSNIARNLRAGGDVVNLSGITIKGDAYIYASKIILDEESHIDGKLTYSFESEVEGLNKATIGSTEVKKSVSIEKKKMMITDVVLKFFNRCISKLIVIICLFWLLPKVRTKLDEILPNIGHIAKNVSTGIIVLVVVPILAFIGLFINFLMPLSLMILLVYIISIYLSNLLVCYIVGKVVNEKLFKLDSWYLYLIIGILIVEVIKLIPTVGIVLEILSIFYGIGLIYRFLKNKE